MIMNHSRVGFLLLIMLLVTSCETNKWAEHEQKQINTYVKSLGDTAYVLTPSGLYFIELKPGTGSVPVNGDTTYFKYAAAFTDYVVFDTNDPITKPVKYVIGSLDAVHVVGVDEGLRMMKAGGKYRLLTPSSLAWGFEGIPGFVAGYTPIVWTIKLDSIKIGSHK
jgi:FKBP-type peptidyl-prolyl cis-trans isomerase